MRSTWYSFHQPWKDERLSQPWSHPVVLKPKPLDWESSTLTTKPLLQFHIQKVQTHIIWLEKLRAPTSIQGSGWPFDHIRYVQWLKVKSCKWYDNKYMITSTQITNTQIFAIIVALVLKILSHIVLLINRKDNRDC